MAGQDDHRHVRAPPSASAGRARGRRRPACAGRRARRRRAPGRGGRARPPPTRPRSRRSAASAGSRPASRARTPRPRPPAPGRGRPLDRSSPQASTARSRRRPPSPPPAPRAAASGTPTRRPRAGARRARPRAAARSYDRSTGRGRSSPWSRRTARRPAAGRPPGCRDRGRRSRPPRSRPSRRETTRTSPLSGCTSHAFTIRFIDDLARASRGCRGRRAAAPRGRGRSRGGANSFRDWTNCSVSRSTSLRSSGVRGALAGSECASTCRTMPAARSRPLFTAATCRVAASSVAAGERVAREGEVVGHALERVVDLVGDARRRGGRRSSAARRGRAAARARARALSSAARASSTARRRACCSAKAPRSRRERHHREVEGVRRAVARPHRLGEAGDRALRLRARQRERPRPRPAVGADGGPRRDLAHVGARGARAARGGWRPTTVPPASRSSQWRAASPPIAPRSRSEAGSTSVSIVHAAGERPRRLAVRQPRGEAGARAGRRPRPRGRSGSTRPTAPGTPPRRPTCTSGRSSDERTLDAHDLGVAAQEEEEGALRGLAQERGRRPGPGSASSSRAIVGDPPRNARSDRISESRRSSDVARAPMSRSNARRASSSGALARDEDAPQSGEVDRDHRGDGDDGQPAGGGAKGLHRGGGGSGASVRAAAEAVLAHVAVAREAGLAGLGGAVARAADRHAARGRAARRARRRRCPRRSTARSARRRCRRAAST